MNMSGEAIVACRKLTCGYPDVPILEEIDLTIARGEVVAILGGSGSGKSTLLKTMLGLLPPLSGELRLFGEDIAALSRPEREKLLRRTGTLFQEDALFGSLTVLENVVLPVRELTDVPDAVAHELVRMKLALVGLSGLEYRTPEHISGGQRKRVALARASILDPELIFCDEPTSGLDPVVSAELDESLRRFRDVLGITIIAVTHSLDTVRDIADRVIMLSRGKVLADGPPGELEQSSVPEVYDFFHRIPPKHEGEARSVFDQLAEGG